MVLVVAQLRRGFYRRRIDQPSSRGELGGLNSRRLSVRTVMIFRPAGIDSSNSGAVGGRNVATFASPTMISVDRPSPDAFHVGRNLSRTRTGLAFTFDRACSFNLRSSSFKLLRMACVLWLLTGSFC